MSEARLWTGGRVFTGRRYAEAVLVDQGAVVAAGTDTEVRRAAPTGSEVVPLGGRLVLPGLIDAHLHISDLARFREGLNLTEVQGPGDLEQKVREWAAARPNGPIVGRGLDVDRSLGGRWPRCGDLDRIVDDRPVVLYHTSGHAAVVNSFVLSATEASWRNSEELRGRVGRNPDGSPSGVLYEEALRWVAPLVSAPTGPEEVVRTLRALSSFGLTTVASMNVPPEDLDTLRTLAEEERLPIRVRVYLRLLRISEIRPHELAPAGRPGRFAVVGAKGFADGAFGPRTAWLSQPYADAPEGCGLAVESEETLSAALATANALGLAPALHAIGDRGVIRAAQLLAPVRPTWRSLGPDRARRAHSASGPFPSSMVYVLRWSFSLGLCGATTGFPNVWAPSELAGPTRSGPSPTSDIASSARAMRPTTQPTRGADFEPRRNGAMSLGARRTPTPGKRSRSKRQFASTEAMPERSSASRHSGPSRWVRRPTSSWSMLGVSERRSGPERRRCARPGSMGSASSTPARPTRGEVVNLQRVSRERAGPDRRPAAQGVLPFDAGGPADLRLESRARPRALRRRTGTKTVRPGLGRVPGRGLWVRVLVLARVRPVNEQLEREHPRGHAYLGAGTLLRILAPTGRRAGGSVDRIYRPRKGDMSTPRTDAFVLPHYQVLCVYLVRASTGDPKAKATLEIALGELEDQRRADPFLKHFEMFRDLLVRTSASAPAPPSAEAAATSPTTPTESAPQRRPAARRRS